MIDDIQRVNLRVIANRLDINLNSLKKIDLYLSIFRLDIENCSYL